MLTKLQYAIDYIEENLAEGLTAKAVADEVGVPERFLNNIFQAITNISLTNYIKSRVLSEANLKLMNGASVTDVAFEFGYGSVDGFGRAFRKWSGFLPSDASKLNLLQLSPKISFQVTVSSARPISCRMESRGPMYFAGISGPVAIYEDHVDVASTTLVESLGSSLREELLSLSDMEPRGLVYGYEDGIHTEYGKPMLHYYGVLSSAAHYSDRFSTLTIPAGQWAVFNGSGQLEELRRDLWFRVYAEWAITSGFYIRDGFTFNRTWTGTRSGQISSEMWLPVAPI